MANLSLTDTAQRTAFFREGALLNLRYWQTRLAASQTGEQMPLEEHNNLLRAVTMALPLAEAWPLLFEVVIDFAPWLERRGQWEAGQWALNRALEVARHHQDRAAEVTLSALLARLLFQQSRHQESVRAYRRVIDLARQIGDEFNEARACTNLGYHFVEQGHWWRAEVLCCHALRLFEQLDSDHGRAHTENHLGFLYSRQHHWPEAQHHLERACQIWQAMGDEHGLTRGYLNLGALHNDAGQPDQALPHLKKALQLAQRTGENIDIGIIYTNMGKTYRLLKDWEKAEEHTKQAEAIFQSYSDLAELSRAWNGLGLIYFHQERWKESILFLEKSLEIWRRLGIEFEEIEVLLDLGECELQRGQWPQAAVRLQEVEQIIGPVPEQGVYCHLLPRLTRFRQHLEMYDGARE